jgi:glycosyltransferase involved in cell wall biosynthesis
MPVHNCAQFLREAIESVLNQTFQTFEFIIVNDGSIDETSEILDEYAKKDWRVRIINQPNCGIVVALNRGLKEAKGEWIFRMDGDDISLPHRFSIQMQEINKIPSLVLLGGWCQQINEKGVPLKINKYPANHDDLIRSLEICGLFFPHPTACFRRDAVLKIGGYRERFRHSEDIDLWLRLVGIGKFACCKAIVLQLRKHEYCISYKQFHLQGLIGMAARICYSRRKAGLSDPSQMEEDVWQEFLKWIEKRGDDEGYFQRMQGWLALRNAWYSNPETKKIKRGKLMLRELIRNSSARKAFWSRIHKDHIILRLVEESKELWKALGLQY